MTKPRRSGPLVCLVTDAGPLINLGRIDQLDLLLETGAPVIIPDAVYAEARRNLIALSGQDIDEWMQAHKSADPSQVDPIRIEVTERYMAAQEAVLARIAQRVPKNIGEECAVDLVRDKMERVAPGAGVIVLICDDQKAKRFLPLGEGTKQIAILSTTRYLQDLEDASRIVSSRDLLLQMEAKGAVLPDRRFWGRGEQLASMVVQRAASKRKRSVEGTGDA